MATTKHSNPMEFLALWAKKSQEHPDVHHPLLFHMLDVGFVARVLWDNALGLDFKSRLQDQLGLSPEQTAVLISFWAGLHDIGKASPVFQSKSGVAKFRLEAIGYAFPAAVENHAHGDVSYEVLRDLLTRDQASPLPREFSQVVALTLGGHHGAFPIPTNRPGPRSIGIGDKWTQARADLYSNLSSLLSHLPRAVPTRKPDASFFLALAGFVCVSDWIGSNETHFHYEESIDDPDAYSLLARSRAESAVEDLGWRLRVLHGKPSSFSRLFPGLQEIRPLQYIAESVAEGIREEPGIVIIEAPMGEGKTDRSSISLLG